MKNKRERCLNCVHHNGEEHKCCFGYWFWTKEEIENCKSYKKGNGEVDE